MILSRALAVSLLLALAPCALAAEAESHSVGFPLVVGKQWGTLEDGTRYSEWRALLILWQSQTRVTPQGDRHVQWALFPLLTHEHTSGGLSGWTVLWPIPIAMFRQSPTGRFSYIFPAIWYHDRDEKSGRSVSGWWVIPLAGHDARRSPESINSTTLIVPYLSHETGDPDGALRSSLLGVFPFYHRVLQPRPSSEEASPPRTSNWGVLPVTWGWRGEEFDHLNLFPLLQWDVHRRLHLFPIFWWGEGYLSVAPFWGRYEATTTPPRREDPWRRPMVERFQYYLFPFYVHYSQQRGSDEPYVEHHVLWPLLAWGHGGGRTEMRFFPFWRRGTREINGVKATSVWALTPFFWHGRRTQEDRLLSAHDVVFPFYWDFRRRGLLIGNADDPTAVTERVSHWNAFVPLWYYHGVDGHPRSLSVLWPLYMSVWAPPDTPAGDNPVFACLVSLLGGYQRWANGDWHATVLGPLFTIDRQEITEGEGARKARVALLWRLFEYTREGSDRGMRLLFLPWRIPLP